MLENMETSLGRSSWHRSKVELGGETREYFYQDPITCIRHLLLQPAYKKNMVYAPTIEYNGAGERMYGEMHTADWWWEMQVS